MKEYTVVIAPERLQTRILVTSQDQALLKAILPPLDRHIGETMALWLQSLAKWLKQPLLVVFAVDEQAPSYIGRIFEELTDKGQPLYETTVAPLQTRPKPARHRRQSISFYDLQGYRRYQA